MEQDNLKSLNQLNGFVFIVPSYQRGYRWTEVEIKRLLNDIWEFVESNNKAHYYPLQPIVVKKAGERYSNLCKDTDMDKCYVLIDGQQRLSTLYIILKALGKDPPYAIVYETRLKSKEFLKNISDKEEKDAEQNPDFYYMHKAYKTIKDWLNSKDATKISDFSNAILSGNGNRVVKVIWYNITEEDEEKVFIRLNAGKIPLTDSELIRGYLLQEKNWKNKEERQRIAREWDLIQMALEDDSFWYFLAGKKANKYVTRMDLLFEIMLGKRRDERYTLFSKFVEREEEQAAHEIWRDIQKIYRYLRLFYENNVLYHLVGFLTSIEREPYRVLKDIFSKILYIINKSDINRYISRTIREKLNINYENGEVCININGKPKRIRDLNFIDHKSPILHVLLLFNILTAMDSKHHRFPFDLYHKEEWSLEHIHARNDRGLQSNKDWIEWYYRNLKVLEKLEIEAKGEGNNNNGQNKEEFIEKIKKTLGSLCESYIKNEKSTKEEICDICCESKVEGNDKHCEKLRYTKGNENLDNEKLLNLMNEIFDFFDKYAQQRSGKSKEEIDNEYGTDDISNLALLSKRKNSALGNQTFAVKRQIIIEMDKNGEFIPPATRNAFLKYYTKEPKDFLVWDIEDRKAYEDAIVERFHRFSQEGENLGK